MAKVQTLAEYLGVPDPLKPATVTVISPRERRQTIRDFCRDVLDTPEYRDSLLRRVVLDELPPQIEVLLYHYAHGKPVEHLEINDVTNQFAQSTPEQLEERALALANLAKRMRREDPLVQLEADVEKKNDERVTH